MLCVQNCVAVHVYKLFVHVCNLSLFCLSLIKKGNAYNMEKNHIKKKNMRELMQCKMVFLQLLTGVISRSDK